MEETEKAAALCRKLVGVARATVTYQIGLPLAATRAGRILYWLEPYRDLSYPVFADYREAVRELPIGSERLEWDRHALRERDTELEKINRKFRDPIFDACFEIIDRFAEET